MQSSIDAFTKALMKTLGEAVKAVAPIHDIKDPDALLKDLLTGLGLGDLKVTAATKKKVVEDEDKESVKSEKKKRVVSKKMKEAYLKMEGATEENLKETMKAYKEATDVESFDAFARERLGVKEEVKEEKKKKATKAKKEKSGRFDKWTPTSKKLFKTIVEDNKGTNTEELQKEFVEYVEGLTDEEFAASSIQGHMRAFVTSKIVKKDEEEEDDEDLEEFEFEDETLSIGVKTGKIYQRTEEAGDVLIGQAGQGRFKNVKKPE